MSVISNQVTISVGQNTCNCPTGEVCVVNGSCPANSFPDQYNQGCCIPCSQLIPSTITGITMPDTPVFFYANVYDQSVHPSCSSCIANCTTKSIEFFVPVSGKVVDSAGHGICNTTVDIAPNNYGQNFVTVNYDGDCVTFACTATVTWLVELGSATAVTDSNGNFNTKLAVSASVYQEQIPDGLDYACYGSSPVDVEFLVNFSIRGTNITNVGSAMVVLNSAISKPL
ncbi:MAG: hypothetical protein ACP5RE_03695 [Candidatus Acidifodinimicrobium sp.]